MDILTENGADYSASRTHSLRVPDESVGRRLDQVIAELLPQHSRNRLQSWIREGLVCVDGTPRCEPKFKVFGGERLLINEAPDEKLAAGEAEDIPLTVVYEDEALLVINKPAGLVVHPGSGNWSGTLLNALLHRLPEIDVVPRAGIVHRLDKDTSGLLVVAKTLIAQTDLVRQLQARTVKRQYMALAIGEVERRGTVDMPIARHPIQRTRMAVVAGGKPAVTHYRILERFDSCTLLECSLETGRTHQIRVHLAAIGYPLLGDPVYAKPQNKLPPFERQALHAARLGLIHPLSREAMQWDAPLPEDFNDLLETLRGD